MARTKAISLLSAVSTKADLAEIYGLVIENVQKIALSTELKSQQYKIVASILTSGPYARRLYYHPEYNFSRAKNPNAQGQWLRPWIDGENKDAFRRAFIAQLRKEVNP